jgi:hypothetical protein
MEFIKLTPFAADRLIVMDGMGCEMLLVLVKATFSLDSGVPKLSEKQDAIVMADEYAGEPGDAVGKEQSVDLDPGHLQAPPETPRDPAPIVAPGAVMTMTVKKKVYLVPGRYLGRLSYYNVIDRPDDPQFVRGSSALISAA